MVGAGRGVEWFCSSSSALLFSCLCVSLQHSAPEIHSAELHSLLPCHTTSLLFFFLFALFLKRDAEFYYTCQEFNRDLGDGRDK